MSVLSDPGLSAARARLRPPVMSVAEGSERVGAQAFKGLVLALVALGLGLRLAALLGGRSLWLDELYLAPNVLERGFLDLAAPLVNQQIAPLGFLFLAKLGTLAPVEPELGLRIWSFLASAAALLLFAPMMRRLGASRLATLIALASVALLERMIWHGVEFKQYGTEFAAGVVMTLLCLRLLERPSAGRRAAFAAAGAAVTLLAFAAPFILAPGGLVALARDLRERDRRGAAATALTGALWLASFAVASLAILSGDTQGDMQDRFWWPHFFPLELSPYAVEWLITHADDLFRKSIGFDIASWLALALCLYGVALLAAARRGAALALCLGPTALAFLGTVAQAYPFQGRLLHFTAAGLAPLTAIGAAALVEAFRRPLLAALCATALLAGPGARLSVREALDVSPAFEREGVDQVMETVLDRREPDDVVYVHAKVAAAVKRFAEREGVALEPVFWGRDPEASAAHYLEDVQQLARLDRVWVVSGRYWFWRRTNRYLAFELLELYGTPLERVEAANAEAVLFDFSQEDAPLLLTRDPGPYEPDHSGDAPPDGLYGLRR